MWKCTWGTLWLTMLFNATKLPSASNAAITAPERRLNAGAERCHDSIWHIGERFIVDQWHQQRMAKHQRPVIQERHAYIVTIDREAFFGAVTIAQNLHGLVTHPSLVVFPTDTKTPPPNPHDMCKFARVYTGKRFASGSHPLISPALMQQLRHITSINDLTVDEIETIFSLADTYLKELRDPYLPHRIGKSLTAAQGSILASLFYEPSTRTRLSFESAMLRLGGKSIGSADPATSSAAKGESLADTVRVASNYADVLVIRHPRDGAVKLAASYASVPVMNGGDGAHEHPTQTLCDLFTLRQEGKNLKHLNVAISGDLKGSRTIHSFVYALARFGANIMLMPAKGMELPEHVDWRLQNELNCYAVPRARYEKDNAAVDALYMTADKPHQLSLISDVEIKVRKNIDAMYVTRFQKERWADKSQDYPTIDQRF